MKTYLSNTRYPLRTLLGLLVALIMAILGGLHLFGVSITPEMMSWVSGVLTILVSIITLIVGEQFVTPVSDPRNNQGVPLVPLQDSMNY